MRDLNEFVAIDTETTGFPPDARIVEVAAVRYVAGVEVDFFVALINPGIPIPEAVTKIHGITDEMVKDAPPAEIVVPQFLRFVGASVVTAHNFPFDGAMVSSEMKRLALPAMGNEWVCTFRLAQRTLREINRHNLASVTAHLGVKVEGAHRALADARGAGLSLIEMLKRGARPSVARA